MDSINQLLVLALGSNIGDRQYYLQAAVQHLKGNVGNWIANSPIYESAPSGVAKDHPPYLNMIVVLSSSLESSEVLSRTQVIEKKFGRVGKGELKPRTLDIDIIWYGKPIKRPDLEIPHPRFLEREFVFRPMMDVLPGINEILNLRAKTEFALKPTTDIRNFGYL